MPANPPRHRRAFSAKLIVLAGSCALSLIALEVFCRFIGFAPPITPPPPDTSELHSVDFIREAQEKNWIHWPSSHTVTETDEHPTGKIVFERNECSFREDGETPIEKPPETIRIAVMGDSHTDGAVWNHESYANLLEVSLNDESTANTFDVINAGFSTFSPYQELWVYQKVVQRFDPDCLIVAFYAGNDLWDLTASDRVHLQRQDGAFVHVDPASNEPPPPDEAVPGVGRLAKNFLRDRLAIYHALANVRSLRQMFGNVPEVDQQKELSEEAAAISSGGYWQSLGQAQYFKQHPSVWDECGSMMRFILEQFQRETQSQNVELLLLVIPSIRQIHPHTDEVAYQKAASHLQLSAEDLLIDDRASELVIRLAADLDIQIIDLRPSLRAAAERAPTEELYWRFDHHISASGHRVVAQELQNALQHKLELPRQPSEQ
ncbi:MAG: SGNH/GDSL hydrolase family protein [Planctomycetes bacterium]|nr:SGNH/GDSL hydrolase family protein [Planctomycetota bacterium]